MFNLIVNIISIIRIIISIIIKRNKRRRVERRRVSLTFARLLNRVVR